MVTAKRLTSFITCLRDLSDQLDDNQLMNQSFIYEKQILELWQDFKKYVSMPTPIDINNLAILLNAYASLIKVSEITPNPDFINQSLKVLFKHLNKLDERNFITLIVAMQRLEIKTPKYVNAWISSAKKNLNQFSPKNLGLILWGVNGLKDDLDDFIEAWIKVVQPKVYLMPLAGCIRSLWTLANYGIEKGKAIFMLERLKMFSKIQYNELLFAAVTAFTYYNEQIPDTWKADLMPVINLRRPELNKFELDLADWLLANKIKCITQVFAGGFYIDLCPIRFDGEDYQSFPEENNPHRRVLLQKICLALRKGNKKVALEADGVKYHQKKNQFREKVLKNLGYEVLHITDEQFYEIESKKAA